ncbi:MAG: insulinase family protein [Gemmatimonadota bacterium]
MTFRRLLLGFLTLPGALAGQDYPTTPPPAMPVKPAPFPPFQQATLPNGLELLVVESKRLPVLSLSLSFPAGDVYDPPGKEGLADMVAGLLTKGAGARSADQIAAAIEGVGGTLSAIAGQDFLTVRADVLAPSAPLAFELLADAVMRPTFPESEVELLRTQVLSGLQLELSQPGELAERFQLRELYGRHPYSRRPTPASVRAIARADLVAFQRARLRPRGALLVVAGDLSLAKARELATRAFAGWTGVPAATAALPAPPARTRTDILLVHRPGSVQSNIVVANLTFRPTDPRIHAATVANHVLGGGSDGRLFMILREQKSWTYGAYSSLVRPRGPGYFAATAEVRTEVTDSALAEMLAQLRRIGAEPVPAEELDAAKGALVGRYPLTIETAGQVAAEVANAKLLGLPPDYVPTYRPRLAAVTAAQVQAAARATIRPEAAVIVVVGDGAKLYERLRAIAPVRIVDPEGKPLRPADLAPKTAALDLDLSRFVARSDSYAVVFQGNSVGFQRARFEATEGGFKYVEDASIGGFAQQTSELMLGPRAEPVSLKQTGKIQGQDIGLDVAFVGGRARGKGTTMTAQGPKPVDYDIDFPAGTIDDNSILALAPALKWAPGAKFDLAVLVTGKGAIQPHVLAVTGEDKVTVPAGTFDVYRAELTGGEQPLTLFVTRAAPHRVVKFQPGGAPIEFLLVR